MTRTGSTAAALLLLLAALACGASPAAAANLCEGTPDSSSSVTLEFTGVYADGGPGKLYVAVDDSVVEPSLDVYGAVVAAESLGPEVNDEGLLKVGVPEGACAVLLLPQGFNLTHLSSNGAGYLALGPLGNVSSLEVSADGPSTIYSEADLSVGELTTKANGPANITLAGEGSEYEIVHVYLADGASSTHIAGTAIDVEVRLLNGAASVYVERIEESLSFSEVFDGASTFRTEGSEALVVTGSPVRGPIATLKVVQGDCSLFPGGCTVVADAEQLWA